MNKIILATLTIITFGLTACGNSTTQRDPANETLPIQIQILIGTFKLENTPQALTSKQAADLLPLWQVYKDLSSSDNTAQPEIDALVEQIQGVMTPGQMQAIQAMNLSRRDMFSLMQDQGLVTGNSQNSNGSNGGGSNSQQGGGGFPGGGGGLPPGGGFPGSGGQGGPNGQNFTPDQIATAQARRSQGGDFQNRIPTGLYDALIKFLEKKSGS
jgi:hypothetical protein